MMRNLLEEKEKRGNVDSINYNSNNNVNISSE